MRVLLVEDHTAVREALARLLVRDAGAVVVRQAGTVEEALQLLDDLDVVVVDLALPDGSGCAVIRACRARGGGPATLVLTGSGKEIDLAEAVEAGADAVLKKTDPFDRVIETVQRLGRGEPVMAGRDVLSSMAALAQHRSERAEVDGALSRLTVREHQVLQALAEGLSDKQIAHQLGLSPDTVRNHVASVLAKLGVESRLQAVLFAIRHGAVAGPG